MNANQTSPRILIVDDNRAAADSLARLLGIWGYQTQVCHDPRQALEVATDYLPTVVILDLKLRRADGFKLASGLREIPGLEHVPLIAVTGFQNEEHKARSRDLGFSGYFLKPVDPDSLRQHLRLVTARKRLADVFHENTPAAIVG